MIGTDWNGLYSDDYWVMRSEVLNSGLPVPKLILPFDSPIFGYSPTQRHSIEKKYTTSAFGRHNYQYYHEKVTTTVTDRNLKIATGYPFTAMAWFRFGHGQFSLGDVFQVKNEGEKPYEIFCNIPSGKSIKIKNKFKPNQSSKLYI